MLAESSSSLGTSPWVANSGPGSAAPVRTRAAVKYRDVARSKTDVMPSLALRTSAASEVTPLSASIVLRMRAAWSVGAPLTVVTRSLGIRDATSDPLAGHE
jgi:hypothetical protein